MQQVETENCGVRMQEKFLNGGALSVHKLNAERASPILKPIFESFNSISHKATKSQIVSTCFSILS